MMRNYFIKTSRIGFGVWKKEDIELAKSLWGNPDVSHFICAKGVFSEQEIENRLKLEIENYEKYKIQYFPIFDLETSNLIGCCGLRPCEEENVFEIGFHLKKEYWHQGLAFEAAKQIIQYAFNDLKVKELRAGHHPENKGSKKLLLKLGFEYIEDCFYPPTGLKHPSYAMKK